MANCIPKHLVNDFLGRIKSGEISPEKLMDMTPKERHAYFASFLGEVNAPWVNASFEQKVLLPARKQGAVTWAKEVAGMKPEYRRDILSKIEKLDQVLTPQEHDKFLEDLVAHKLGMRVSLQEASNLSALAKDVADKKSNAEKGGNRLEYGAARYEFDKYYGELKTEAGRIKMLDYVKPKNWWSGLTNVAGVAKALKASLDISVIGRQGLVTAITHPEIWAKNSAQAFVDFANTLQNKDVMKAVMSDVLSRPNSLNGMYRKEGLAVGVIEENYPTPIPERIPVLGKIFKASQDSFTAWQYRTRADVFDKLVNIAQNSGAETKGIGTLVNSMTGRGNLGTLEPHGKMLNNIFFSPRFLRANFDVLTAHKFGSKDMSPFARRQASINLLKVVGAIALVMAIAKAIDPESVEEDPRSSDFGKIKVGNTRFNISGGMSGLVTLASRLLTWSSKNGTTDIITKLNEPRFGARNVGDVVLDFFGGKLSPAASIIRDVAKGKDFKGKPPTIIGEMQNLLMPIPITNFQELVDDKDSAPIILALIADGLGIGTNTYSSDVDWTTSQGKEMLQFRDKVGDESFKEANKIYNDDYAEWLDEEKDTEKYQDMDDAEKRAHLQSGREKIKNKVFRSYNFKYKKDKAKK